MCMGRVRYTLIFFHGNNTNSIQMYMLHKFIKQSTTHLVVKMLSIRGSVGSIGVFMTFKKEQGRKFLLQVLASLKSFLSSTVKNFLTVVASVRK